MDNSNPFLTYRAKSQKVSISRLPDEAWDYIIGGGRSETALWRKVPWLRRGVDVVGQAVAGLPFEISRGGEVVTESGTYEDPTGGALPRPSAMFSIAAASLLLYGKAYFEILRNLGGPLSLKWLKPDSIKPKLTRQGLEYFERHLKTGEAMRLEVEDVLHVWLPDPEVEIGPPLSSAVDAALMAAGAASSIDAFVDTFFERGAIKTTIFGIEDPVTDAELSRIRTWWGRLFRGEKSAWEQGVVNAKVAKPTVIGEGLESLDNEQLSRRIREDIATALGVPHSILFSNASNFAVAEQDYRNLYQLTVAPLADCIETAFNDQLLADLGLELRFNVNALDIFQEDEEDRTGALLNILNGMVAAPPGAVVVAMQMLGFELPGQMTWEQFEALLEEEKEEVPPQLDMPGPGADLIPEPGTRVDIGEDDEKADPLALELDRWQRKASKALKQGRRERMLQFESDHIPDLTHAAIVGALEAATSAGAVRAAFIYG